MHSLTGALDIFVHGFNPPQYGRKNNQGKHPGRTEEKRNQPDRHG
jgi:hypothetical protein